MRQYKRNKVARIVMSLSSGYLIGHSFVGIIIPFLLLVSFPIGILIYLIIAKSAHYLDLMTSASRFNWWVEMVAISLGFLLAAICLIVVAVNGLITLKKVLLYLDDAVEVNGYIRKTNLSRTSIFIGKSIKIQAEFELDGVSYVRLSGSKKHKDSGYYPNWIKNIDRKVQLLYSPKYDEVLILKDEKKKK